MIVVDWLFEHIGRLFAILNNYEFDGAPLGIILLGFLLTSMVISVFWRGARG